MKKILITIPTYRRPEHLVKTLNSIQLLDRIDKASIEVLVVENDSKKSVTKIIEKFQKKSKIKTHYVLEKNRGLVCVRNRILAEAYKLKVDYLVGIDDDEVASKKWLTSLWSGMKKYKATVTTGVQIARFEKSPPKWLIDGDFFVSESKRKTGTVMKRCSTGNYLIDMKFIKKHKLAFDMKFNFIGAEDADFFEQIPKLGGKIVWINEAIVFETIPGNRMTLGYLLKRDFRIGNGRMARILKKSGRITWFLSGLIALFKSFMYSLFLLFSVFTKKTNSYKMLCKASKQLAMFLSFFKLNSNGYK